MNLTCEKKPYEVFFLPTFFPKCSFETVIPKTGFDLPQRRVVIVILVIVVGVLS